MPLPKAIVTAAKLAQLSSSQQEALMHQRNALDAAWGWGLSEFKKTCLALAEEEAEIAWTRRAGERPGHRRYWVC